MNLLKSPGGKISAVFVGTGIVLCLLILVLIFVKLGSNKSMNQEIDQIKISIENIQAITEDQVGFNKECEKIKKKSELSLEKIPQKAQIPSAIDQLTSAIEYLNLKLISIEPKEAIEIRKQKKLLTMEMDMEPEEEAGFPPGMAEEAETKPDYVQIPIEIRFRGAYPDIGQYMDSLRYLPRLVTVEKINIEKTKEAGILDTKLIVSVYYQE